MFLYYYPGNGPIPDELRYVITDTEPYHKRTVMHGPLGRPAGTIFAMESHDPGLVKLDEPFQKWKPFPGDSPLCVGLSDSVKPDPQQLTRPTMLRGHVVKLADGTNWLVPIARGFDSGSEQMFLALPIALEYECSTGRWIAGGVETQYKAFFDLAQSHASLRWEMIEKGVLQFEDPDADALAIVALQTNYRVSSIELSFFPGAYTPRTRQQVLDAILDIPTWMDWHRKKKELVNDGIST